MEQKTPTRIVIVGAGQAGAALAAKLRRLGFAGAITMIGAEAALPYERPPLSKAFLLGKIDAERLQLRPPSFYREQEITLLTGQTVQKILPQDQLVRLEDEALGYDALALTTGSAPRKLPDAVTGGLRGVHVLRNIDDARALAKACGSARRALVVGGGYVGLEATAVFRGLGIEVTLVELGARILSRVAAPETADRLRDLHLSHGVTILEGTGLAELCGNGRVEEAVLTDGTTLPTDLVLAGIGAVARDGLARDAGLAVQDGILVDRFGRSSDPAIYAAGDCARFPFDGVPTRLESVQNAVDQAEHVAANMLGQATPYHPVPWFWSDQYDLKLQIAGLGHGHEQVVIRPGKRDGAVSHWYFRGGSMKAVDALNDPASFMLGRRLLEKGCRVRPEDVGGSTAHLRQILESA
ncbi:pyridine nucleotide-disulfide oxidoreductase (plasmid) [Paracoccus versutus]|uniref:3-phenylpropionate/trans-cinnamate dioxygenase ferredoxin reductase subunit n=2 Tax=Paracoccus versutus TaxID=34007 RepID=A0A3D9XUK4_PARVE|nr:3-phenylpropionate/trans-cinnamate dioxygenase ferredoxin reductase subunit [Paracoccus versutus]WGR56462.1 pyridine nucleotide-disulfide oxidoreductase [Paracoccus versutus]